MGRGGMRPKARIHIPFPLGQVNLSKAQGGLQLVEGGQRGFTTNGWRPSCCSDGALQRFGLRYVPLLRQGF